MNGLLITFEGADGAGKTSVLEAILPELDKGQRPVLATREPGGVRAAEAIRDIILAPDNVGIDGKTEMLLFAAARRIHLQEKVAPALASGHLVVIDRFIDSSVAYQAYGRGLAQAEVDWLNHYATDGLKPDLTIYLDVPTQVGLSRIHKASSSNREINRLDLEASAFHERVRRGYQDLAKVQADRFVTIDANQAFERVVDQVLVAIKERFDDD